MRSLLDSLVWEIMDVPYLIAIASKLPGIPIRRVVSALKAIQNKIYPRYHDIRVYHPQWYNFHLPITRETIINGNIGALGIVEGIPLLLQISDLSNTSGTATRLRFGFAWSLPIIVSENDTPNLYSRFEVNIATSVGIVGRTVSCNDLTPVLNEQFRYVEIHLLPPESYLDHSWKVIVSIDILSPWNNDELESDGDEDSDEEEMIT